MTREIGSVLTSVNPATLEVVAETTISTPAEIEKRIAAATAALPTWRRSLPARQDLARLITGKIHAHADALAELLTREQGKPLAEAKQEIWIAAEAFRAAADVEWETSRTQQVLGGHHATVVSAPYGVIAAIVPWNFPIYLAAAKIAPALIAGNTVIVKPAETVSRVVTEFVEIVSSVLPEGVIGLVAGGPSVGQSLVTDRRVRKVSFTGSTQIGREIIRQSAEAVTPLTLELGGNDPAILLADADIAQAAERLAAGAFMNAGQMCIAPKRVYVPRAQHSDFTEALAVHVRQRVVGDGLESGTTMGPLHNRAQRDFVEKLIADAIAGGARVVTGGPSAAKSELPGHFLAPTVLTDLGDDADVVRLEQFGPVLPIIAYDNLDEVLTRIDGQEFGLGASVWSADTDRARQVAEGIEAGTVWINKHNALDVNVPFGGVKASGFGREGGRAGIDDFLITRVIN